MERGDIRRTTNEGGRIGGLRKRKRKGKECRVMESRRKKNGDRMRKRT